MKKILCLIIALINIFCFANAENFPLSEEEKTDLYNLGIMKGDENGNLNLDDSVTRAEFSKMICTALGFSEFSEITLPLAEEFHDVKKDHWAYYHIQIAKSLHLIDGVGNGYFSPDDNITLQDAVKITVCALGYKEKVTGEYPTGYIKKAEEISLIKNPLKYAENYASRAETAHLIAIALDIPLMKQTTFGKNPEYTVMDGTDEKPLITLRTQLVPTPDLSQNTSNNSADEVPRFNGEEYTGRILKISNLEKADNRYKFKNSLNSEDNATYIITEGTYIYLSDNTLNLSEIKNDMYMQCWYYTNDTDEIELLKIELMKEKPAGI